MLEDYAAYEQFMPKFRRSPPGAYFGDKEPMFGENIRVAQQRAGSGMLKSIQVSGNHMSALPVALDAFRKTVTK